MKLGRQTLAAVGVMPGEGGRVAWLIAHSLFIGVFCAFFLTAANALFLDRFEITFLPMAYIAAALVGYVAMMLFSRLERMVSVPWVLVINLVVLTGLAGAFWYLTRVSSNDWVVFFMFVAVGPMFSLIFLGYWGLAVRLFDLRQGKRLFGLVGAGEEVSTIVGLFSIPVLLRYLAGPVPLLLIAVAGLVGCLVVVVIMTRLFRAALGGDTDQTAAGEPRKGAGLGRLLSQRYFLLMAGLIILLSLAHYIVDFSFLSQIRMKFQGPEQIARFLGLFFGVTKILELIMKVLVSGRLVSQFGLKVGLMVLPVVLAVCAGFAIAIGTFGLGAAHFFVLVALAKLVWVVARTSTFLPSFRVLYQPVERRDRLAYQTHVDGTAQQLAIGLVGVGLLVFSRSASFNALNLFYILVPILAVWIVAVVMLHRQYRGRLMQNISTETGPVEATSPVDALIDRLLQVPPDQLEHSIAVLARVDATAVVPMLVRMVEEDDEAATTAALRYVEQLKAVGALEAVQRSAARSSSPEIRAAAGRTLHTLNEVLALAEEPDRVGELAASPLPAQRDLAVSAIGFASNPQAHVGLTDLLWDKDRDVRRAALVAAGRVGDPTYWHRIISQLFSPRFSNAATFGLITIGEPVLGEIEKTFSRAEPELQARILRIYERIGGPTAHRLLLAKLGFPDKNVRAKSLVALSQSGFIAGEQQASVVANEIEQVISTLAWNVSALLDLSDDEAVAELRTALETEIDSGRDSLFLLLSLLSDPRAVSTVKSILDSGRAEATVYALEIMDIVISPELKPLVFPVLEDLPYPQLLRRLDALVPRQRLNQLERLSAIINREHDKIGLWTRTSAVRAIAAVSGEIAPDLIASLFHPEPIIRETAARCIFDLDPEAYRYHRKRLPFELQQRLDAVIDPELGIEGWETRSVLGRAHLLRSAPAFRSLSWESLIALATTAEERVVKPGQRFPTLKEPKDCMYLVVDGELVFVEEEATEDARPGLPAQSLVAFGSGASPIEAVQTGRLIRLDPTQLFELATEYPELVPVLLRARRQVVEVVEAEGALRQPAEAIRPEAPGLGMPV